MSAATQNVKKAIDALRDVAKQIALLLKTADGCMDEHGWRYAEETAFPGIPELVRLLIGFLDIFCARIRMAISQS